MDRRIRVGLAFALEALELELGAIVAEGAIIRKQVLDDEELTFSPARVSRIELFCEEAGLPKEMVEGLCLYFFGAA